MFQCLKARPIYSATLWSRASAGADWWRGRKTCSQDSNLFVFVCLCHPAQCFRSLNCVRSWREQIALSALLFPLSDLCTPPPILPYTLTHIHRNSHTRTQICLTLFSSLGLSLSLSSSFPLLLSFPPSLQRPVPCSQHSFLCLNCEHHNRANDVSLLCHTCTLCPLVLCLGNRPGWQFFGEAVGGGHFLCRATGWWICL